MENIQEEIIILNVINVNKDGKKYCVMNYVFASDDKLQSTDKFLGYFEQTQFYDSSVFSKFRKDILFTPVIANFKFSVMPNNPSKVRSDIVSIETDEDIIHLL